MNPKGTKVFCKPGCTCKRHLPRDHYWTRGENSPMKRPEVAKKSADSRRGRVKRPDLAEYNRQRTGEKNPMYGKPNHILADLCSGDNHPNKKPWDGVSTVGKQVSEEKFWDMMTEQEYSCWMCNEYFSTENASLAPVVDHDHNTGEIRGLAHRICNLHYDNPFHQNRWNKET